MSLVEWIILNFVHADGQTVSSRDIERLLSETKASSDLKLGYNYCQVVTLFYFL